MVSDVWESQIEQEYSNFGFILNKKSKNIVIPNVAEKNILILLEEKKNNLIQNFCHKLMLILEKNFTLCATKKINIITLVLSEKKILNETKNHNPPSPHLQVKWSVPNYKTQTDIKLYIKITTNLLFFAVHFSVLCFSGQNDHLNIFHLFI